jgi:transposase-like protein
MPTTLPRGFRRGVVAVAREGVASISQVAKDFGISEWCLPRCQIFADIGGGVRPGATDAESAKLREARKRVRVLEPEVEISRCGRLLRQGHLPKMTLVVGAARGIHDGPLRPKAAMTALRHGS